MKKVKASSSPTLAYLRLRLHYGLPVFLIMYFLYNLTRKPIPYAELKKLGIPPPPEGRYMSRFEVMFFYLLTFGTKQVLYYLAAKYECFILNIIRHY